jgi:hypothetical protein
VIELPLGLGAVSKRSEFVGTKLASFGHPVAQRLVGIESRNRPYFQVMVVVPKDLVDVGKMMLVVLFAVVVLLWP